MKIKSYLSGNIGIVTASANASAWISVSVSVSCGYLPII